MNLEKQKLLISYLIGNPDLYWRVSSILQTEYFDPKIKPTVKFIKKYFDEYKNSPTRNQVLAETSVELPENQSLDAGQIKYAESELETFCRNSAIEQAIYASPALLQDQNFGAIEKLIREAIAVGIHKDLGLRYFEDPEARLRDLQLNNSMFPTGILDLDEALGGGLNRKEMTIFLAGSGVGKSIMLLNVAMNYLKQKLNVLYITLELAEKVVSKRADSLISGIGQVDILKNIQKVSTEVLKSASSHGHFQIKYMKPSTTKANDIRSYLKEYEIINGFAPDVICVDYLDIMASNEKISVENVNIKDKYVSEELRSIGNDYDCIMLSASQLNRGGADAAAADLGQSGIAGGFTKIFTADNVVAIQQTEQMKAAKEYLMKLLKTRSSNGVGKFFMVNIDPVSLRVTNKSESGGAQYFSAVKNNRPTQPTIERAPKDSIQPVSKATDLLKSRFNI